MSEEIKTPTNEEVTEAVLKQLTNAMLDGNIYPPEWKEAIRYNEQLSEEEQARLEA